MFQSGHRQSRWIAQGPPHGVVERHRDRPSRIAVEFFLDSGKEGNAVNTLATGLRYFRRMSDSLERLYLAVIAAKDLDPATSRTARLFQRGPAKMAKKLAEEAVEVVIDAVSGNADAVVRESADLLYNLTVLWASAGVRPEDVWREMERREHMLGIAEKLPKMPKEMQKAAAPRIGRRPIVALASRHLHKRG
jgi:phosphoribosyl-ATP pyrophosphohydrolase